jgi:hypothetical protein
MGVTVGEQVLCGAIKEHLCGRESSESSSVCTKQLMM